MKRKKRKRLQQKCLGLKERRSGRKQVAAIAFGFSNAFHSFFFLMLLQIVFIQLLQFSEWIIYETNPDI